MIVAALERFADPSRRCDARTVAAPGDQVVTWDLPRLGDDPLGCLRAVPRGLAAWLTLPLPVGGRWRLLRACLATGGARLGAVLRAPDLLARVRRRDVDAIACLSLRDFGLASRLAEETGRPCRETLARGTQYLGEFAFELLAVIPYAYWLHTQGRLDLTVSTADTRCLYYFSKHHEERPVPRRYARARGR